MGPSLASSSRPRPERQRVEGLANVSRGDILERDSLETLLKIVFRSELAGLRAVDVTLPTGEERAANCVVVAKEPLSSAIQIFDLLLNEELQRSSRL